MLKSLFENNHWYERLFNIVSLLVIPIFWITVYLNEGADSEYFFQLILIILITELLLWVVYRSILYITKKESFFNQISTPEKKTVIGAIKITLYILLALVFFLTWGLRQSEPTIKAIPWFIHLGIFWLLFIGIRKIKS